MPGNDEIDEEDQVRKRAYELWEQEGKPDGRHDEFWHQALAEITGSGEDVIEATRPMTGSTPFPHLKTNNSEGE